MKKLNKIYLAIPYSKMDTDLSFSLANEMMVYFLNKGNNVFSPITHTHPITKMGLTSGAWDYWGDFDRQFVDWADEIVVIIPPTEDGVELVHTSVGVNGEIEHGNKTGKPHRFFDYETKKFVKLPELVSE